MRILFRSCSWSARKNAFWGETPEKSRSSSHRFRQSSCNLLSALGSLWRRVAIAFAIALFVISRSARAASRARLVLNSTGGTMTIGTDFVLTGATVANPAGTISIDCPITSVATAPIASPTIAPAEVSAISRPTARPSVAATFRHGRWRPHAPRAVDAAATSITTTASPAISAEPKPSTASSERFGAKPMSRCSPVTSQLGSAPACCGSAGVNSAYTPVYITNYSFSQLVQGR